MDLGNIHTSADNAKRQNQKKDDEMALTAEQFEIFEENQNLRDRIFELVKFKIKDFSDYLKMVDNYDHCGTIEEVLKNESVHLKKVLENNLDCIQD